MKNTLLFAATLALFGAGSVQAREIPCNYCTTTQFSQTARNAGIGTHVIYDTYLDVVKTYEVTREPAAGGYRWYVNEVPTELDVQNVVNELTSFRIRTNGTMVQNITIYANPDLGNMSAYDIVQPGGQRTHLLDWFQGFGMVSIDNSLGGLATAIHSMAGAAAAILKNVPIETTATVLFSDGSRVDVKYDPLTNTATVKDGTALDAAGNPIPRTMEEATTINFNFDNDRTGRAAQNTMNWLVQLGIYMNASPPTPIKGIKCVGTPGGKFECTPI